MKIEVGKVLKAQGIKGEVKLSCSLDSPQMLKNIKKMYLGANVYAVAKFRCDSSFCYVLFEGIDDRNAAESLRNKLVFVDKENVALPTGRFFVEDLVGCSVVVKEDNAIVGTVLEVLQYGSADVFVCDGTKPVSFPFLKDVVVSVDTDNKTITVDKKRFFEVAVYED